MTPENRQASAIVLIFIVAITACGAAVYLAFSLLTINRDSSAAPTANPLAPDETGVVITAVSANSPGARAGLLPGYIILEANKTPINSTESLQALAASLPSGSEINLILLVDGERRQTTAVRAAEPPYLGIEIINRADFAFDLLNTPTPPAEPSSTVETIPAVLAIVAEVVPSSPADTAGLQAADVITAVNGQAILSADELVTRLGEFFPGDVITLTFRRDAETLIRSVTLGENPNDGERPFLGVILEN